MFDLFCLCVINRKSSSFTITKDRSRIDELCVSCCTIMIVMIMSIDTKIVFSRFCSSRDYFWIMIHHDFDSINGIFIDISMDSYIASLTIFGEFVYISIIVSENHMDWSVKCFKCSKTSTRSHQIPSKK